jgi:hypothetical protein
MCVLLNVDLLEDTRGNRVISGEKKMPSKGIPLIDCRGGAYST